MATRLYLRDLGNGVSLSANVEKWLITYMKYLLLNLSLSGQQPVVWNSKLLRIIIHNTTNNA